MATACRSIIDIYDGSSYHLTMVDMDEREEDYIIFVDDAAGPPLSLVIDRNDWILQTNASESYGFHLIYDPLGDGTQFVSYIDSVIAKGGTQPYSFSVVAGNLPNGIELGASDGTLTGAPTEDGLFTFTVEAVDNGFNAKQVEYTLFIVEGTYVPGDADGSGIVDIDDITYLLNYIFSGGPAPTPIDAGDANGSCEIDIDDAVYLIIYVFLGGPLPLSGCVSG